MIKNKMKIIKIVSLNQEKPNTCGSCKHTQNDLGMIALHCKLLYDKEDYDNEKRRSWNKCCFKPSKYANMKTK